MAVEKPVPVPKKEITSVDLVGWASGLNLNGAQNAPPTSFVASKDAELTVDGFLTNRRVLAPFLPDTVETTYQKMPVIWNGLIYYFVADNNKIRFCQEGDSDWTDCGGSNTITTNNGGKPKFLRILDNVILMNGTNGDKLCYVDLSTPGFPVVKYTLITDPGSPPTAALTNLTAGASNIYYAYSYTGPVGETLLSPILTQSINITRDQWQVQTSPGSITITRPGPVPAGATFWNLYVANAATAGTIASTDMLQIGTKIDLTQTTFVDDASLSINLGSIAPLANGTDGPKVNHGVIEDGNPILFGDTTNPENIYIGGGGPFAMDFSISNGGYLAQPEQGTNFQVTAIIGFRNGQGIPSLTVLYSNTEGLSKQSVLEQQTVNYGNQSFNVWGVKEQHYGAAGVAATDSAINYNGKLLFLSTDGFMSMNTQPLRQNVIATDPISVDRIDPYVRAIKVSAMGGVIGAGWDNKFMWTIPNAGFDTPQQILIQDDNNQVQTKGAWYTLDIPSQWIGVVTPTSAPAFVYVSRGNKSYKLIKGFSTFDTIEGASVPFSTNATGPLVGMGGPAHNHWQADVQVVFYVMGLVGDITVGVNYRPQGANPQLKTKTKVYHGPAFTPSVAGGWGDPGWSYGAFPSPSYSGMPMIDASSVAVTAVDVRIPLQINDLMSEAQWFYSTPVGYGAYKLRAISFEGLNLGVRPDLQ